MARDAVDGLAYAGRSCDLGHTLQQVLVLGADDLVTTQRFDPSYAVTVAVTRSGPIMSCSRSGTCHSQAGASGFAGVVTVKAGRERHGRSSLSVPVQPVSRASPSAGRTGRIVSEAMRVGPSVELVKRTDVRPGSMSGWTSRTVTCAPVTTPTSRTAASAAPALL
jgi:hypothetical protein